MSGTVDCHQCGDEMEKQGLDVSNDESPYWEFTTQDGEIAGRELIVTLPFCSTACAKEFMEEEL